MSEMKPIYTLKPVEEWQLVERAPKLHAIISWKMFTGDGVTKPEYANREHWDSRWSRLPKVQRSEDTADVYSYSVFPDLLEACASRVIKCGLAQRTEESSKSDIVNFFDNFTWNMKAIDKLSKDLADVTGDLEENLKKETFCVCFYSAVMTYLYPNLLDDPVINLGLFSKCYCEPADLSPFDKSYEDFKDCLQIDTLRAHMKIHMRVQGMISMKLTLTIIDKYFEWKSKNEIEMQNLAVAAGVVGKINQLKKGLTPAQQVLVDKLLTAGEEKSSSSSTHTVRSPTATERHYGKIQKAVDNVNKAIEEGETTTTTTKHLTPQENGSSSLTEGHPPLPDIPKDAVMPESGFKISEEVWLSQVGQNQLRSNADAKKKEFTKYTRSQFEVTEILEKGGQRMYKTYVIKHKEFSYEVTGTALRKLQYIGSEYHNEDVNKADYYTLEEYLYESMHETVFDENPEYKQKFYYEALINGALKADKYNKSEFVDLKYALASYKMWDLTWQATEDNRKISKFGIYDSYELVKYKKDVDKRDWVVYDSDNGIYSILCVEDGTCIQSVHEDEIKRLKKKKKKKAANVSKGKTAAILSNAKNMVGKKRNNSSTPGSPRRYSNRNRKKLRRYEPEEFGMESSSLKNDKDQNDNSNSSSEDENPNTGAGSAQSPINVEDGENDDDF